MFFCCMYFDCSLLLKDESVACTACLCVPSVWQSNCPLSFYEDGITGVIYKIFKTSPWVGWIGLNAMGHIVWVSILFICQLYQVLLLPSGWPVAWSVGRQTSVVGLKVVSLIVWCW